MYANYAAAYTLSQQGTFYDVTLCNKILTQCTGRSTASLKQLISDDGCDCSISWHYSVNAAEQHRQLLEVGLLTEKSIAIQNIRVQGFDRAAKDDNGSKEIEIHFYYIL